MPKPLANKPGAEKGRFRPDVIETYHIDQPGALLDTLFQLMPARKRTTVKELLKHGQVAVNGTPVTLHSTELHPGDKIEVNLTRQFQTFSHPRVKLVYEDDDIIVINKGYGLLSVSNDRRAAETAYSIVREYLKRKSPANKVFVVHRLDRDTTGLMMFAKTPQAKEAMQHNWNNMVLERKYVAVVEGIVAQREGVVKSYLAENSQFEVYSTDNPEEGQLAVTRYKTLRTGHGHSLMELQLDTGRKNQIRVHMKDLGHPIAGDRKYGAGPAPIHRLALHAQTLRFAHPVTRRDMNFTTPVPAGFLAMVK